MNARAIDCVLVGNESLLVRCGDALQAAGARVSLVVSEDPAIGAWAAGLGIPCEVFDHAIARRLGPGAVDYVFSIGNLRVLPAAWLALARDLTINFHDGPLPKYAGLHAPSWALMHGETTHGVTWHIARPDVDAGEVLEQVRFPIEEDDTAFTVNAKCYDAGIQSFAKLVDLLIGGALAPRRLDASDGASYFSRTRRPTAAGHVDWSRPIHECAALVRALDFGPYANPLCTPWSWEGGRVTRVDHAAVARVRAGGPPPFDPLPPDLAARISQRHQAWSTRERTWVDRCRAVQPLAAASIGDPGTASRLRTVPFDLGGLPAAGAATLAAAMVVWLARAFEQSVFDVGYRGPVLDEELAGLESWFETLPPLHVEVDLTRPFAECVTLVASAMAAHEGHATFLHDLVHRYPELRNHVEGGYAARLQVAITVGRDAASGRDDGAALVIHLAPDGSRCEWRVDAGRLQAPVELLQRHCAVFLRSAFAADGVPAYRVPVVEEQERRRLLVEWNQTSRPAQGPPSIADQFEAQVRRTPGAGAVATWRDALTYGELNSKANRVARGLQQRGVGRGQIVGLYLERSLDMVVALLGVLKAGAAYLPLDPSYPLDRTLFSVADSGAALLVTHSHASARLPGDVARFEIDAASDELAALPGDDPVRQAEPGDLAYVIYTSGSTGKPKGVMLDHANVTSFFAAMDSRIDHDPPGVWLAVTSLSFDISVLELLWTLCRGFSVVLQCDPRRASATPGVGASAAIDLSLFYFASDESAEGADRYRLLMEGAVFADRQGFEAVWTPERHFHAFGGLYPNPAITSAAIAAVTTRVKIRAGSLVLPLHHPVRAAEDWSLVDNLSNGRVGIAFASGWHPNDFVLAPQNHRTAKQVMFDGLATMRRLWRGEAVTLAGPDERDVTIRTLPRPVQPELPFWITTAGNPDTFRQAGDIGANVLTHLLGQTIDEVAGKIRAYRDARRVAGHAGPGHVTLMLHTFVGHSDDEVREIVRAPMKQYLGSSLNLVRQHAWSFPAFKGRAVAPDAPTDDLFRNLSAEDLDALLDHSFERYFETGGLFGSEDTCVATVERLRDIGVDEIACLIDFGVPAGRVLSSLDALAAVRRRVAAARDAGTAEPPAAELIERHGVTHLQCTPSMAAMLLDDPAGATALGRLRHWLVGGEALAAPLARRMRAAGPARVTNMYGPTETTVWSLTHDLGDGEAPVPIGRPIDNTRVYVLDGRAELVPIGSEGELYIGGPGVARGYLGREGLTAERFVPSPFGADPGDRVYRTGDRVRFRSDGLLDFLGRMDQQVKVRGHRIELGEIEEALRRVPGVRDAAVVAREDVPGDVRLAAYVTSFADAPQLPDACVSSLREWLPEVMIPSAVVVLDALPVTPNGKIDRRALPPPGATSSRSARPLAPPEDDLQRQVAAIWEDVLRAGSLGIDDNFFDLGGHSLLTMQVASRLSQMLGRQLPFTDLFRFPTIRGLARHLAGEGTGGTPSAVQTGDDRAAARRAARMRRGREH